MNTIQFRIDFETKQKLLHDAFQSKLSLSALFRRLVELYMTDDTIRQKVL